MAAGQGFKTFTTGEVLTAADVNGYLMQGVLVFASEAARNAAITSPQEGQFAFTKDTNGLWYYDGAAWVASGATGDIEGVTAGVGISGGGTSGTVTVTNSMATAIDAKGDLVPGTGADTFARLAVGANGTVLTADSAETTGLKWATPSSTPAFVGCRLTKSADQTISNNALTAISFNVETFDTDGFHDNVTNNTRITIPTGKSGKYALVARFTWDTTSTAYKYWRIRKNTSALLMIGFVDGTTQEYVQIADILDLTAGDYIEFECYQNSGGNVTLYSNAFDQGTTVFGVQYLGA
jgi:hypothetical protein